MMLTQRPRGTADILPGEVEAWQRLEEIVRNVFRTYNYGEIRTPIFEHTDVFARGVGETTDIVSKEMYTFTDRGDRSITLRPEGTAGVVRAYVENKLYGLPGITKLYYIGPMFRYENPQKGRQRQFHQYGCEVLGSDGPAIDAEVISLNLDILQRFGLKELTVELNSVGCSECRPVHKEKMLSVLRPERDRLCKDCKERLEKNPLRIFDCKNKSCQLLLKEVGAPTILDELCEACETHFTELKAALDGSGVPYTINPHLVRGLDYYTRTAWEVTCQGFGTVSGGGRYNGLVRELGGPETPGIGFAGGMERALMVLEAQGAQLKDENGLSIFVAVADSSAEVAAAKLLKQLRDMNITADRDYQGKSIKAQFKQADRLGAKFVAVLGETEVQTGTVTLKDLETGLQEALPIDEALKTIQEKVIGR
jgi:histidyl-tRNA synthetase